MAAAATMDSMPIVRYCRERKASAPSRIASEMARISGLPVSAASTCRARMKATTRDTTLIPRTSGSTLSTDIEPPHELLVRLVLPWPANPSRLRGTKARVKPRRKGRAPVRTWPVRGRSYDRPVLDLDLDAGLARLGYQAFRPGQREAVFALLQAGRLLQIAPTGGGKSLTYQLPASLLPGTSLVISPLVSLMHDQVQALEARGIPATFLAATLSAGDMRERLAALRRGAFKLAYVSPERLAYPGFHALALEMSPPLVAVDEAHCISEWGHDFRPEYLAIGGLLAELRPRLVLACTATATPIVRDEILVRLGLGPDTPQLVQGFARPNLALRVRHVTSERERDRHVDALLEEALGRPGALRGTAIVYAPTRRSTEEEAARLAGRGWRAEGYHAGMSGETRTRVQRAFGEGRSRWWWPRTPSAWASTARTCAPSST